MILGIDASNIRAGGGVTHLVELLRAANPTGHGFSKVIVWSGQSTLNQIEDRPWLEKSHQALLNKSLLWRVFWQRFRLSRLARTAGCVVLFVPGGFYAGNFRPFVAMSQNLLPFEMREIRRYGWTLITLRLILLRYLQSHTFSMADGLIFLTRYAENSVLKVIKTAAGKKTIIPHGINERFSHPPRDQHEIAAYSKTHPFNIIYVSNIEQYKHQWKVVEAIALLRAEGFPVVLNLIGPEGNAINILQQSLDKLDPESEFTRYWGAVPHAEIHARYAQANLNIFASSCETFGIILVEGMSAGLPIACSNRSAMPELLKDAGIYFNPEKPVEIATAVRTLIQDPSLRAQKAEAAYELARKYSWRQCAEDTFSFLSMIAQKTS